MEPRRIFVAFCLLLAGLCSPCEGQEGSLRYIAGARVGSSDGVGPDATFESPQNLFVDGGFLYVEDRENKSVRRVDLTTREVTTTEGRFPRSSSEWTNCLTGDGRGSLYLCFNFHTISGLRRLDLATGTLAPLAGQDYGLNVDGWGSTAGFGGYVSGAVWANGSVYVLARYSIRRVEVPSGRTSVVAGDPADTNGGYGPDGPALLTKFYSLKSIAADAAGNLYVGDDFRIRKIDLATGLVSTIAGGGSNTRDGVGTGARFESIGAIAVDAAGNIAVCEPDHHIIRKIEAVTRRVSTFVGTRGLAGNIDGLGNSARLANPSGVAFDAAGNLYVSSTGSAIRRVDPAGNVTTIVGPESRVIPEQWVLTPGDYIGTAGLAANRHGLYALDARTHEVKKILLPFGEIASIAGRRDVRGSADGIGTQATFSNESVLQSDGEAFLYVYQNQRLRRITRETGEVVTLPFGTREMFVVDRGSVVHQTPGGALARTDLQTGVATPLSSAPASLRSLAVSASGDLFAAYSTSTSSLIARLDPGSGAPTPLAGGGPGRSTDGVGSEAVFEDPRDLCFDGDRSLYVLERGPYPEKVRRVDLLTKRVTTVLSLSQLRQIACDGYGRVFVADIRGVISEIMPLLADQAVVDSPSGPVGTPRIVSAAPDTAREHAFRITRRPSRSTAVLSDLPFGGALLVPDVADLFEIELTATDTFNRYRRSTVSISATELRCISLTTSVSPPGGGTVTVTPPSGCPAGQVPRGAVVSLSAQGAPGQVFAGWSGTGSDRFVLGSAFFASTTVVGMTDFSLEARFVPSALCVPVFFTRANRRDPVNCQGAGGAGFLVGSTLRVVPAQAPNETFSHWKTSGVRMTKTGDPSSDFEVLPGGGFVEAVFAPGPPPLRDSARSFYTLVPCRIVDSRDTRSAALTGERRAYPLSGVCGIPAGASAISANVTALDATGSGELKVYAAGSAFSPPAVIPVRPGPARAVGAFVRLSMDGGRAVIVETANGTGTTHFILDVNGYWQ